MIERERCQLSIRAQCRLLGVNRSTVYYEPRAVRQPDLAVMRLLDEQYTLTPQYGIERMTAWLKRKGIVVGHNRVRRLMRLMGQAKSRVLLSFLQLRAFASIVRIPDAGRGLLWLRS